MESTRVLKTLPLLACLASLPGCAEWSPPVAQTEVPSGSEAYLYGRFHITSQKAALSFDGYATIGLEFICKDQKRYTVRFSNENSLQVIKLKPSTCSLGWILFTNADGSIKGSHPAPTTTLQNIEFKPGSAYYIGDYSAAVATVGLATSWNIGSVTDNFAATTGDMQSLYPSLATLTTVDQIGGGSQDANRLNMPPE